MTSILIAVGSARKGSVAHKLTPIVADEAAKLDGVTTSVIELDDLQLPFFNNERSPSDPEYVATDEHVIAWGKLVAEHDAVVFVTPEYNHNLSALQKNAIDSLFTEWNDKPIGVIAYGWSAGIHSVNALKESLPVVKADLREPITQLQFTKDIAPDASLIDEAGVREKLAATLRAVS